MVSPTRPYLVTFQGKRHLLDAISKEQAVSLVVAPHVSDVKAATAGEVRRFYESQRTSPNEISGDGTGKALPPVDPGATRQERLAIGEEQQD